MAAAVAFSTSSHAGLVRLREALDGGQYVSGQSLAQRFGMSRTAIWKELGRLRTLGYRLEGSPRRGYRLLEAPDVPYPWEVARGREAPRFGHQVIYFPEVGSTNDEARKLAEQGADEGWVVVADRQTRGRGRRGRPWASPPGGLWFSVVLRPSFDSRQVALLPLVGALAVVRAVESLCPLQLAIKWPNDVLAAGRKVCGILAELAADHEAVRFVVMGIGINLEAPPLPADPGPAAADGPGRLPPGGLRDLGCPVRRTTLLGAVLDRLQEAYTALQSQGPGAVLGEVAARLAWQGQPVRVDQGERAIEGRLVGLDLETGALVLDREGERVRLFSGDVSLRRTPAEGSG